LYEGLTALFSIFQYSHDVRTEGLAELSSLSTLPVWNTADTPEDYPEIRQMLSELINEVNHIGNNINQIARKNNAGFYNRDDMESLRSYMRKLILSVREVEKKIGSNKGS
jgi:hypothetical protein